MNNNQLVKKLKGNQRKVIDVENIENGKNEVKSRSEKLLLS